jgi:serine/threonine protein kinase
MTARSSIAPTEPPPPLALDGFELGPPLGEGRLGVVHAACAPGGRRAAIKILDPGVCTDARRVADYLNEAVVVGALRHPNMVEILDMGQLPDGRAYVVMERLEGESLGQRLRRVQALPLVDVIDFARQAAAALAAAHDEGLVHGALEPENLFLVPDLSVTRGERVKVLDFGAWRLRTTALGAASGSSLYLAPEQAAGPTAAVDQRADVFALAAILYHALCGGPPFPAGLVGPELDQPPEKPSALTEVPPHVERALLGALARDPGARFSSMAAFMEALAGTDVPAVPPRPALRIGTLAFVLTAAAVVLWSTRTPALVSSWMQRRVPAAVVAPVVPPAEAPLPSGAPVTVASELASDARPRRAASPRRARQHPARRAAIIDRDDTWGRRH